MKLKLLDKNCKPHRAHKTDSGLDLRARLDLSMVLQPMWTRVVPTGVAIELPLGYEAQVRPRSGLSKMGVIAAFGTIDNGYTGEIGVTLINTSLDRIIIEPYERIAQLVIAPIFIPEFEYKEYKDELSETERGASGFGSTGRK
jgi:dUTP pyrophosphatase